MHRGLLGTGRRPVDAGVVGPAVVDVDPVAAVARDDPSLILTGLEESMLSHRIVWAAEHARRTGATVTLDDGRRDDVPAVAALPEPVS